MVSFCIVKVLAAAWRTRAGTLGTRSSPAGVVAVVGWTTRKRRCPVRPRRLQLAHPGFSLLDGLTIAVGYLVPYSSAVTKDYSILNRTWFAGAQCFHPRDLLPHGYQILHPRPLLSLLVRRPLR